MTGFVCLQGALENTYDMYENLQHIEWNLRHIYRAAARRNVTLLNETLGITEVRTSLKMS